MRDKEDHRKNFFIQQVKKRKAQTFILFLAGSLCAPCSRFSSPPLTTTTTKPQLNLFLWLYFFLSKRRPLSTSRNLSVGFTCNKCGVFPPLFIHFQVNVAEQEGCVHLERDGKHAAGPPVRFSTCGALIVHRSISKG